MLALVLRAALNTGLRWRLVTQNVATLVDAPRAGTREIESLTPEQAQHLLTSAKDDSLRGFVTVDLASG